MKKEKLPDVGDEVTHISGETSGTVIARYRMYITKREAREVIDVRIGDEKIIYATFAENWKVVRGELDE